MEPMGSTNCSFFISAASLLLVRHAKQLVAAFPSGGETQLRAFYKSWPSRRKPQIRSVGNSDTSNSDNKVGRPKKTAENCVGISDAINQQDKLFADEAKKEAATKRGAAGHRSRRAEELPFQTVGNSDTLNEPMGGRWEAIAERMAHKVFILLVG